MHHPETNPHFIRLQSRDHHRGSPPPSTDASPPHRREGHRDRPVGLPSQRHGRGQRPDAAGPPAVQIRPRDQQPQQQLSPPPGGQGHGFPVAPQPQHHAAPMGRAKLPPVNHDQRHETPIAKQPLQNPYEFPSPQAPRGHHQRSNSQGPLIPPSKKTNPIIWSAAVCCAIFWVVIILGGVIVLIVYLVYRPHSPHFDIMSATLNSAYLDMGYLLNADLSLLANFTNPSKKGSVDFSYVTFELYYYNTLIATQYIEPFSAARAESMFANVHLISSQVRLPLGVSQQLRKQIDSNGVTFNVKGIFHARSNLGSLLRYSYWLYSHCTILVTGPPTGILRARRCNTKR